jgi:hypothetical protein
MRGSVSQPSVETGIENQSFSRSIAHRPKIPDGMAAKQLDSMQDSGLSRL